MKKEVLIFVYIVWAMLVGHRVWNWRNLKEDGWQGGGMPFLPVEGGPYSQCRNESGKCKRSRYGKGT